MKIFKRRIVFIFLAAWFAFTSDLSSQVICSIKTSSDTVVIGDPLLLNINIELPSDIKVSGLDLGPLFDLENKFYNSDTVFLDKKADLSILDYGSWKSKGNSHLLDLTSLNITKQGDKQVISNQLSIAIYNMGSYRFSCPNIISEQSIDLFPSEMPSVIVLLPEKMMAQDSVSLNPIKDIIKESANISDYLTYIYILIGILLLLLLARYFKKNKKEKIEEVVVLEVVVTADEKAINALNLLKDKALWQQGKIKEYQSELTFIIRRYLEERYHFAALEMTTDEISDALLNQDFDPKFSIDLKEILQIADLVKFAKAIPGEDVHSRFMDKAYEFVDKTKSKI